MTVTLDHLLAELRSHAKSVRDRWADAKYPGWHAFVLAHGRTYTPQPRPKQYRLGPPRACFDNAYRLAKRRGLVYVEGFTARADAAGIPILHAWCVEPGSEMVIENTLGTPGDVYYGVPINLAYRTAQGGSVLDNWRDGWPILQHATDEALWRYLG